MSKSILAGVAILSLILISFALVSKTSESKKLVSHNTSSINPSIPSALSKKLSLKGDAALKFAQQKGYNTELCFLIDMTRSSAQKRFFIYDLRKDSILKSGLVTHGRCNEVWLEGRRYSNRTGSGCTSLGKYRIGKAYHGRFGLAYKLHGLEASNSNAFARYVVLHAHECVPEKEGVEICQSDGCPTVAPSFLKTLASIINHSPKPVLLWTFE